MSYTEIILAAAKSAKISGALLLAICTHESHLKNIKVNIDVYSPSYGLCQVKMETAEMLGYKGTAEGLMIPEKNAEIAAKYLKYQLNRYSGNQCKAVSAYNSGTYSESKKIPGKPRNLAYVKLVREKLDRDSQYILSCEPEIEYRWEKELY